MEIIAYYLPQYHPTRSNDKWWGKGFTEWTNVAKAKRLYPGHYQPKVPADLGFYDLRLPEVREQQAELAKEAGVTAFCYYHYWFGGGHQELERPFNEVVESGKPDFPFCLCWANETWYSKFWNKDGSSKKTILAEQLYLGRDDNENHFYHLLKAFKDKRYLRVDGRLLFVIYKPLDFKDFSEFRRQWDTLAQENGLPPFFFVGQTIYANQVDKILGMEFDGVNHCRRMDSQYLYDELPLFIKRIRAFVKGKLSIPYIINYSKAIKKCVQEVDYFDNVYPTMMPNWDHTPRSKDGGSVLHNATPELFYHHAKDLLNVIKTKKESSQLLFLKSWNEWGEGNYMEPDLKYGKGYIESLNKAIKEVNNL